MRIDKNGLEPPNEMTLALVEAARNSRIAVVPKLMFSSDYQIENGNQNEDSAFCSHRKAPYSLPQVFRGNIRYLPLIDKLIEGDEVLILIRHLHSQK